MKQNANEGIGRSRKNEIGGGGKEKEREPNVLRVSQCSRAHRVALVNTKHARAPDHNENNWLPLFFSLCLTALANYSDYYG